MVQTVSSYFVVVAVMSRWESYASACTNQIRRLTGQNGGNCVATVVGGSSNNMSVTVRIVSPKENPVNGVDLVWVTNSNFCKENY